MVAFKSVKALEIGKENRRNKKKSNEKQVSAKNDCHGNCEDKDSLDDDIEDHDSSRD